MATKIFTDNANAPPLMLTPPISDTSEFMIIEYSNAIGALDIQGNMGAIPEG